MSSNEANFFINGTASAAVSKNHQMAAAAATAAAIATASAAASAKATGKPAAAVASVNPYSNRFGYAQAQAQAAQEAANHLQQYVATSNALAIPASTAQTTVFATAQQPNTLGAAMQQQQQVTYQFFPQNSMVYSPGYSQANYPGYSAYHHQFQLPPGYPAQYYYGLHTDNLQTQASSTLPVLSATQPTIIQSTSQLQYPLHFLPPPPPPPPPLQQITPPPSFYAQSYRPQLVPSIDQRQAYPHVTQSQTTNHNKPPNEYRLSVSSTGPVKPKSGLKKWFCKQCQQQCFSEESYRMHLAGKRHQTRWISTNNDKETSGTGSQEETPLNGLEKVNIHRLVTSKSQCILLCPICRIFTVSVNAYYCHLKGGKHKREVRVREENNQPVSIVPSFINKNILQHLKEAVIEEFVLYETKMNMDPDRWAEEQANRPGPGPSKAAEKLDDLDAYSKPVGLDFIEEILNESGKTVCYMCTLCEVRFNDANAKEAHLRGRKHRIAYKKKIDPSLIVMEVKSDRKMVEQMKRWEIRAEKNIDNALYALDVNLFDVQWARFFEWRIDDLQEDLQSLKTQLRQNDIFSRYHCDWLVHYRHDLVAAPREMMVQVHEAVCIMEIACLSIADVINNTFMHLNPYDRDEERAEKSQAIDMIKFQEMLDSNEFIDCISQYEEKMLLQQEVPPPMLRSSVMKFIRVKSLGKGFLLADDNFIDGCVLYCNFFPTTHLKAIYEAVLATYINSVQSKFTFELVKEQSEKSASFILAVKSTEKDSRKQFQISIRATFTAGFIRNCHPPLVNSVRNLLDREQCLDALSEVRRVRWFKEKVFLPRMRCIVFPFFQYTVRVLRSICRANSALKNIPEYCIELVIVLICNTHERWQAVVPVIRYFFEVLASGILFPKIGVGIGDPCQRNFPSCFAYLSIQERENYTRAVQHIILQMRNGQMRQVLNISKFEVDCLKQEKNPQAELKKISTEKGPEEVKKLLKIGDEELPDEIRSPVHEVTETDEDSAEKITDKSLDKNESFFGWMEGQINKYSENESNVEKRSSINQSLQQDHGQSSKRFKPGSSSSEFSQQESQTCEKFVPNEQLESLGSNLL